MKPIIAILLAVSFAAGVVARDFAQDSLANSREADLMSRELACTNTTVATAYMARLPWEPDNAAHCVLVPNAKPSPRWYHFFNEPIKGNIK